MALLLVGVGWTPVGGASETALLPYGASGWVYAILPVYDDAPLVNAGAAGFAGSIPPGANGVAPFGTQADNQVCPAAVTFWPTRTTLVASHAFTVPSGVEGLRVRVMFDNDVAVMLNGLPLTPILNLDHPSPAPLPFQSHDACAVRDSFIAASSIFLPNQQNIITAMAVDRGSSTYFDLMVERCYLGGPDHPYCDE